MKTRPDQANTDALRARLKALNLSFMLENHQALAQTAEYMDTTGTVEGHLVWFDRGKRPWQDKIYRRTCLQGAHAIELWVA